MRDGGSIQETANLSLKLSVTQNKATFVQVFGFLTKPLVRYLLPQNASSDGREPKSPKEDMTLPLLSFDETAETNINRAKDNLSMLMERPVYTIHYYWKRFDNAYMKPIFGGPIHEIS